MSLQEGWAKLEITDPGNNKSYEEALEIANQLISANPTNAEVYLLRAKAKQYLWDFQSALEDLEKADVLEPNKPLTLSRRGNLKFILRDYEGALEDLNRANQLEPNNAFILSRRGAVLPRLFHDNEHYKAALEDLNTADQLRPNNAFILSRRGDVKRLLRDFREALLDLDEADRLRPDDTFTLSRRGEVKRLIDDYTGALEDLGRANQLSPNDTFILRNRGDTFRQLYRFEEAINDYDKALEIDPGDYTILSRRGETKRRLENYEGALEDLDAANNLNPNNADILACRGAVKFLQGNFEEALVDLHRANDIQPNNKLTLWYIDDAKQKLERIKNTMITQISKAIEIPYEKLTMLKKLGEGGQGEVHLALCYGEKVAVKKVKQFQSKQLMMVEAEALLALRNKYIVTLKGVTIDPQRNMCLIIEYFKDGSLDELLFGQEAKKLSLSSVIRLALDIAKGLKYLHSRQPIVIHRDLKSANVLLHSAKQRAKISDFGTAKVLHPDVQPKTVIGAVGMAIPPEMLDEEENYNEKVDLFSFGVVLYEMLTNKRLSVLEEPARLKRILQNIVDVDMAQLVTECCKSDPKQRPSIDDVIKKLKEKKATCSI